MLLVHHAARSARRGVEVWVRRRPEWKHACCVTPCGPDPGPRSSQSVFFWFRSERSTSNRCSGNVDNDKRARSLIRSQSKSQSRDVASCCSRGLSRTLAVRPWLVPHTSHAHMTHARGRGSHLCRQRATGARGREQQCECAGEARGAGEWRGSRGVGGGGVVVGVAVWVSWTFGSAADPSRMSHSSSQVDVAREGRVLREGVHGEKGRNQQGPSVQRMSTGRVHCSGLEWLNLNHSELAARGQDIANNPARWLEVGKRRVKQLALGGEYADRKCRSAPRCMNDLVRIFSRSECWLRE